MQKNNPTANSKRNNADESRFTKRIGSVTYDINVFFNEDTEETMDVKIQRLMRNEVWDGYVPKCPVGSSTHTRYRPRHLVGNSTHIEYESTHNELQSRKVAG